MVFGNPLTYFRRLWRGQGRARVPFPANDITTILDLPVEIRLEMWKYLSAKEQTALRQVCSTFHNDATQFLGVYAELTGPRPWSQWTLSDQKRCIFALRNTDYTYDIDLILKENWDWITNSQVQSLSVLGLAWIPPDRDCSSLVRNRHSVRRLVIALDENTGQNGKVQTLLNAFSNLQILNVSWELAPLFRRELAVFFERQLGALFGPEVAEHFRPEPTALEEYRQNAILLTREIAKSLVGRHTLRELCVKVDIPLGENHAIQTFLGMVDDPTTEQKLDYPTRIEKLKLVFPIMHSVDRPEISGWRALLDRQTQLRHLTVDLGFVYWTIFRSVLIRNAQTLEELDMTLSNWFVRRTPENWNQIIPLDFRFNWRALTENDAHLKSLLVVMSAQCGIIKEPSPHETLNFDGLNLARLERLEFQSVHLTRDHFIKIFVHLPILKKVKLIHWHDLRQGNLSEAATDSLGPVLFALLRSNHLEEIKLLDWCIVECPKRVRKLFHVVPNYDVVLPSCIFGLVSIDEPTGLPEMLITRKPANQLTPPIFE